MAEPQPSLALLKQAIASDDRQAADRCLQQLSPADSAHVIAHLSQDDQQRLLTLLPESAAAELVEAMPEPQAAQILEQLEPAEAAAICNAMASDEQADLIGRLPDKEAQAILERMEGEEAADARRLMQYPPETAGGLMISEYLAYVENLRVEDVVGDLRRNAEKYAHYDVQYAYVVSPNGRLRGVLRLRDLLLASSDTVIGSIMNTRTLSVPVHATLEDLERFFERQPLYGVPVVERDGTLVGVVRIQDVEEAAEERSGRSLLKFAGIAGGEELRSMPVRQRSFHRLSWLSINILLNVIAASVIVYYEQTLAAMIALAAFLPIISDMSGCSGNQAVAVSIRELTLGIIRPREFWRVLYKEAAVGLINGLVLGLLLGLIALAWKGSLVLAIVVTVALALNTVVAVCIGGCVPLLLRGLGRDPALASGPLLTTITDLCGFFLVLSLATAALAYLGTG